MNTKQIKVLSIGSIALSLFAIGMVASHYVFAAITDGDFVNACVKNSNGSVRIIDSADFCNSTETRITWNKDGVNDFGGFISRNLSGINLQGEHLSYRKFEGVDFSNANLNNATLDHSVFKNANLSGATLVDTKPKYSDFSNANLTNTNLSAALDNSFQYSNFTNAIFVGTNMAGSDFGAANFTNVHFMNANLYAANGFSNSPVILIGVTWANTTCPDGTNSDNNGNTCEGHLNP